MKKLLNYSLLMFLFSFIAFACSKEDGDVGPSASLMKATTNGTLTPVGNYDLGCINDEGGNEWSFAVNGPGNVQREGLSHLNLKLYDCEENEIDLSTCTVTDARIVVGNYTLELGTHFIIEYEDGGGASCGPISNIIKFEMKDVEVGGKDVGDILKESDARFYFTLSCDEIIASASVVIKTGNGCSSPAVIHNCDPNACDKDEPEGPCSYSQGYWFASPVSAGWGSVTVGGKTLTESKARELFKTPRRTDADKAFLQAAAIILSGLEAEDLPTDDPDYGNVRQAFECILALNTTTTTDDGNCKVSKLGTYAGILGDWISANPCPDAE